MRPTPDKIPQETVSAVAGLAEARQPSAAGHQRRVADISAAIANELDLDADVVNAIRFAGELHDIGKVGLPAELLTRTSRLSLSEWELIKSHCQIGYEIVAEMSCKWHTAEMVLQHHERCDGSGYPAGLRGEEILFGARILAVADTIEDRVWSSPAGAEHGLESAVEEVRRGSGTLFDRHVVTAGLRLFREGRLSLSRSRTPLPPGSPAPLADRHQGWPGTSPG